jgi:hypothetical protein
MSVERMDTITKRYSKVKDAHLRLPQVLSAKVHVDACAAVKVLMLF